MCDKCGNSGLLPFTGKDGRVRQDVHIFCDCHPIYGENAYNGCYSPLRPEDIDYPVSYSFYRSLCLEHGWSDPGDERSQEIESEGQASTPVAAPQEIIHRHSDMGQAEFNLLQEHDRTLKYLMSKQKGKEEKKQDYEPF